MVHLDQNMIVVSPLFAGSVFVLLLEPPHVTRFLSHVASTGLAFATYLAAWRRCKPLCGLMVELTVGALIHSFVNTAYYWPVSPTGVYQLVAALALFIAAVGALHHLASQEPLSARISGVFPTER